MPAKDIDRLFKGRPFSNISVSKVKTFCFSLNLIREDAIFADTYNLLYLFDVIHAAQVAQ